MVVGAWLLSIVVGGGNAVGSAFVVEELDPFWGAAIRFIGSGVVFALLAILFQSRIGSRASVVGATLYGIVGFAGAFAFFFVALTETPPGTGQLLIAVVPLLTFGLAIAHRLERFRCRGLFGAVVAVAGVAIVFADRVSADVPLLSLVLVLAGALCVAESAVSLQFVLGGAVILAGVWVGALAPTRDA